MRTLLLPPSILESVQSDDSMSEFTDFQSVSSDSLSKPDNADVKDVDDVHRCRLADHLQSNAPLSSGTFALPNLSARMHRGEALYFHDEAARGRVYDSTRLGFLEAHARLYGVCLRRSIELQRGIVYVRTPTVGSSNIAWGKVVYFTRFRGLRF